MNNNFKVKKTSLKQKIDFTKNGTNELDKVFGIEKSNDLQNVIDALSKKTTIAEMLGMEETYYIAILKDTNVIGTKSDLETMFSEHKPKQKEVLIYELKSPKPISFSIETKISLKLNN
jgi:hypothetical protein